VIQTQDPPEVFSGKTVEALESRLRAAARGLMAEAGLSQTVLARTMEISQSSVSHMLTDRSYGLTASEVSLIEMICRVPVGTLYRHVGLIEYEPLEKQIYDIPGITNQAAEAIVAAIQAVKANALRQEGRS
jgi:hypothetical protein